MKISTFLILFRVEKLIVFDSEVDLGSGVKITVEGKQYRASLLHEKKKPPLPKDNLPKMHAKEEEFSLEGETYKVERSVLRYEALEDVLDELPDFIKEILDK